MSGVKTNKQINKENKQNKWAREEVQMVLEAEALLIFDLKLRGR